MSENSGGFRWGWVVFSGKVTAAEIVAGMARYADRFGRYPGIMFVHPDHMAGGLQAPLGVIIEVDPLMNRTIVEFGLPEDEAPGGPADGGDQ